MSAEPARLPIQSGTPPAPKPPRGLSADARRLWRSTVAAFELEPHHLAILEQACRALDRIGEARDAVARDGMTLEGRFGAKAHPMLAVERDSRIAMMRGLRELGLDLETPATSRPPTRWR